MPGVILVGIGVIAAFAVMIVHRPDLSDAGVAIQGVIATGIFWIPGAILTVIGPAIHPGGTPGWIPWID